MLGPDGVGQLAYILWLIEVVNVLCSFGLPNCLTRYVAELNGRCEAIQASVFARWLFLRYLILALVGSIVVGVLFGHSSQHTNQRPLLPVLMLYSIVRSLQVLNQADLAGKQRFDLLARINVAATVSLILGVVIGTRFFGVLGSVCGYTAGASLSAAYTVVMFRRPTANHGVSVELRRRATRFSYDTWLAMVVSVFIWSRMEVFFLERYWDNREVGMFTIGLTFASLIRQTIELFTGAFTAHFTQLMGAGDHETIRRQYVCTIKLMALVVFPLAFGGAAIMPVIIPLVFGRAFVPAVPCAMVMMLGSAMTVSAIGTNLMYAKERSRFIALCGVVGAVLSVTAGFMVVSRFGAWGAVWSRVVVQGLMVGVGTWYIITSLHFGFPFRSLARTFVASVLSGILAFCVSWFLPDSVVTLLVAISVALVVYAICVRVFQVLGLDEVCQLARIMSVLPERVRWLLMLFCNASMRERCQS